MVYTIVIPGKTQAKQRPRLVGKNVYTPKETRDFEAKVRKYAKKVITTPIEGDVAASMIFFMPTRHPCDIDNLAKSVLDGLNGVGYDDDSNVVLLSLEKTIDVDEPRCVVWLSQAQPRCDVCKLRHGGTCDI